MRTILRCVVVGVLAAAFGVPVFAAGQGAAGVTKDLKGWRDVAWGATPDQVSASIGKPLSEQVKGEDSRTYFRIRDYSVGAWTTNLVVIFSGAERLGLSSVMINFRKDTEFKPVVDELTARYGAPTSTKRETENGIDIQEASWLFPSTEVTCRWRGPWGIVVYQPRAKGTS